MTRLKKECGFDIWYLLYADDLVFIAHHSEINKLIKALKKVMLNFNLILNPKKSGIMRIRKHIYPIVDNIEGIPFVESYRYLGVLLD